VTEFLRFHVLKDIRTAPSVRETSLIMSSYQSLWAVAREYSLGRHSEEECGKFDSYSKCCSLTLNYDIIHKLRRIQGDLIETSLQSRCVIEDSLIIFVLFDHREVRLLLRFAAGK
jgi:hypothetical protein